MSSYLVKTGCSGEWKDNFSLTRCLAGDLLSFVGLRCLSPFEPIADGLVPWDEHVCKGEIPCNGDDVRAIVQFPSSVSEIPDDTLEKLNQEGEKECFYEEARRLVQWLQDAHGVVVSW